MEFSDSYPKQLVVARWKLHNRIDDKTTFNKWSNDLGFGALTSPVKHFIHDNF